MLCQHETQPFNGLSLKMTKGEIQMILMLPIEVNGGKVLIK